MVYFSYSHEEKTTMGLGPTITLVDQFGFSFNAVNPVPVILASGGASANVYITNNTGNYAGLPVIQFPGATTYANVWAVQQSLSNKPIAVGAANTVIKAFPGSLTTICITVTGTTGFTIFDNATTNTGTILYQSVAAPQAGSVIQIGGAALLGMTAANTATGPAFTVFYS